MESVSIETVVEKFNDLGLKTSGIQPQWRKSCSKDSSLIASVTENDTKDYQKAAQDIATTLRVLDIVTAMPEIEHFQPYGPMWGMQAYTSSIIIPLSLIDLKKLDMWQTGAKMAQDERMRANARRFG